MSDTINGRTPEEIKKGLECCIVGECSKCPYMHECDDHLAKGGDMLPADVVLADMHSLIQQLERERDAAVKDLKEHGAYCSVCLHNEKLICEEPCATCSKLSTVNKHINWQWRGPEVE